MTGRKKVSKKGVVFLPEDTKKFKEIFFCNENLKRMILRFINSNKFIQLIVLFFYLE